MCLYETKLKNMKYLPTKKNMGNVPKVNDYRQLYIKIGCGWCKECRKKIATDWKTRLYEEYKNNNKCIFVTFSYSPEKIKETKEKIIREKYKGINGSEIDVNILAAYTIRKFTEKWRKKFKKNPRYWFITELGHTNSERLHLHGIMWNKENITDNEYRKNVLEKWNYGNVYIGKWVDERTINYIIKYITKIDDKHKGYKQKTFVSKGLGLSYVNKYKQFHKYNGENTITTYTNKNGTKVALPRYYKEKIWNDEEREKLWTIELNKNTTFLSGKKWTKDEDDVKEVKEWEKALKGERKTNELVNYGDINTKNVKYIITEAMEKNYKELKKLEKEKLVTRVERRKVERTINYEKKELFSKEYEGKFNINGEYIGTTTESERNRNDEILEAKMLGISVRELRLKKAGII